MAEITGGELKYVATIDVEQFKKNLSDGKGELLGFTKVAENSGEALDGIFKKGNVVDNLKKIGVQSTLTGKDMKNAIKDADDFIKGMEGGLTMVLDYQSKLQSEISKLPEGKAKDALVKEYQSISVEIEKVSQDIESSKKIVQSYKDENVSLATKLRAVTDEMKVLYDRGEQNSTKYAELKERAIQYREAQDSVNKQVQIASGPQGFNGLINTLTFAAGGFSAVQGAIGLLGGESDDLNKIMLKVQSTLALVIGLQEIQKQVSAEGAFNITVLTKVKQLWAIASLRVAAALGITTVAAQALMTLGLSAVIAGIIYAFNNWTSASEKVAESQREIGAAASDSASEAIAKYKLLQNQWFYASKTIKEQEKFVKDNKEAFHDLGFEIENVNDAEKFLVDNSQAVIEMMMLKAKAAAQLQIAQEKYKKSLEIGADLKKEKEVYKEGAKTIKIEHAVKNFFGFGSTQEREAKFRKEGDNMIEDYTKTMSQVGTAIKNINLKTYSGNHKTEKTKSTSNSTSVAEEFLPIGSVAEIQKRLSKIDELLAKSTDGKNIEALKLKRVATEKELAEAEAKIKIETLQEQFDESERLWEQYYDAVSSIGKEAADKIFGEALKKDKASFEALEKQRADLLAKGNLTDEEKNYFTFIDNKINSLLGKKTRIEQFKQTIEETLSTLITDEDKLKFLDEKKSTANKTNGEFAVLQEYNQQILDAQKQRYQEFLAAHQSFEEKKNAITKQYAELRNKINSDPKLNNSQKKVALEKAAQEEADAYSDAFMNELVNNPKYREAFADLERQTTAKLIELRNELQQKLTSSENLNPEAQARIRRDIEELNKLIGERNPYKRLKDIIKELGNESLSTAEKLKKINEAVGIIKEYTSAARSIINDVTEAISDMGIEMSDSTKDFLNNVNQTLDGIDKMADGFGQFMEGFAEKDPIKMIAGAVKFIGGAIKAVSGWLSGDNKRERQIKRWANAVEQLKNQYKELEKAVESALGTDKYTAQQDVIANLEKQKILLQQMIQKEDAKKKTDQNKINDWKNQISDINSQIDDIKKSIINDILQIDAKGLADKIGNALIEGFGKGEDALQSLNKTADEVFKEMVKNALKLQLEKKMQPIIDQMLKAMGYSMDSSGNATGSFDGLTEEERAALKAQIIAATGDYQKAMEQYADLFGPDSATNSNGLKGDIKNITEKTAGALEAQINMIRTYQVEALNVNKKNNQALVDSLRYLSGIESNTRNLIPIKIILDEILTKIKKL